jgi:hypothetical protein
MSKDQYIKAHVTKWRLAYNMQDIENEHKVLSFDSWKEFVQFVKNSAEDGDNESGLKIDFAYFVESCSPIDMSEAGNFTEEY